MEQRRKSLCAGDNFKVSLENETRTKTGNKDTRDSKRSMNGLLLEKQPNEHAPPAGQVPNCSSKYPIKTSF